MYFREFKVNWRPLVAVSLGASLGGALSYYTMSLFAPALLAEFHWPRSQFALIGVVPLAAVLFIPFVGWFADRFGVGVTALIGFAGLASSYALLALMGGDIVSFFAIYALQSIFAILTTVLVFCRVVVERFDTARGLALSAAMFAPPLAGAIAAPLLGVLIDVHGWRIGFAALAFVTAAGGLGAIVLLGPAGKPRSGSDERLTRREIGDLLCDRRLLLMLGGMFLINLSQVIASSQLKLIIMDRGASGEAATWMISLYAIGVMAGRLVCGFALDQAPPHLVAFGALGLPAIGYILFAAHIGDVVILALAVATIGFAQGAENDVGAYFVSRRFALKNFSLLLSLLTMMIAIGSAVGSGLLSVSLQSANGDRLFLIGAAATTLIGAAVFAAVGRGRWAFAGND